MKHIGSIYKQTITQKIKTKKRKAEKSFLYHTIDSTPTDDHEVTQKYVKDRERNRKKERARKRERERNRRTEWRKPPTRS